MSLAEYGEPREITIPVPYGHLAAKEWGPQNGQPLLGLHGWLHNASAFDDLVLYLPPIFHFVILDFPGHGRSSHLPNGAKYSRLQMIIDTRRVIKYLGWKRFSIIGHSLGGYTALFYASAYSREVENVISLDVLYPASRTSKRSAMSQAIDKFLREEKKELGPPSSIDDNKTLDYLAQQHEGASDGVIRALLDRGSRRLPDDSVILTRDWRLRAMYDLPMEIVDKEIVFEEMAKIRAGVLVICGSDSFYHQLMPECQQELAELLQKNCRSFQKVFVQSNHSPHIENPQEVAMLVIQLLVTKANL